MWGASFYLQKNIFVNLIAACVGYITSAWFTQHHCIFCKILLQVWFGLESKYTQKTICIHIIMIVCTKSLDNIISNKYLIWIILALRPIDSFHSSSTGMNRLPVYGIAPSWQFCCHPISYGISASYRLYGSIPPGPPLPLRWRHNGHDGVSNH